MMQHDEIRQSIAAYALDALDASERAVTEARLLEHLPGCEECSAMMRDFRDVAGDLSLAAPPVAPSPLVERRIMSAIRDESRKASASPRRRPALRAALAVATLALAASAVGNVALLSRANRASDRAGALAQAVELAAHPDATTVALRAKTGTGSLAVAYRPDGSAVLVGTGVPQPPEGRVFELWLLDGDPIPVKTFVPDDGVVVVRFDVGGRTVRGAAITVEKSFVPAPTTEPIYAGTVS